MDPNIKRELTFIATACALLALGFLLLIYNAVHYTPQTEIDEPVRVELGMGLKS